MRDPGVVTRGPRPPAAPQTPEAARHPGGLATTDDEVPVYIPLDDDHLFGVVTRPTVPSNGVGVVVMTGGSWVPCTHRNRMYVKLARRLAALGYTTLRVDYRGVGESTGEVDVWDLESTPTRELDAAATWLRGTGVHGIVLVGTCFGGRTSLAAAHRVPDLEGLALVATPVVTYRGASRSLAWHVVKALHPTTLRRLLHPMWRRKYARILSSFFTRGVTSQFSTSEERGAGVSAKYLAAMAALVDRKVPILIAFGEAGTHYGPFRAAAEGPLRKILDRAGDRFTLVTDPGELHGFLTLEAQEFTLHHVERWIVSLGRTST